MFQLFQLCNEIFLNTGSFQKQFCTCNGRVVENYFKQNCYPIIAVGVYFQVLNTALLSKWMLQKVKIRKIAYNF